MRILDRSVYVGPSLYAHFPGHPPRARSRALSKRGRPAASAAAFVDALAAALPGLAEHGCSYREPGGFFRRMREDEGTWLGHVLEHVAIELQNMAGEEVTFGKTRSAEAPGVYTVVYEYAQRDEGIAAGELGLEAAVLAAARGDPAGRTRCPTDWSWQEARDEFIRFAQRRALGPVDGRAGAGGRAARHSLAAPERPVAGAARPRQVPAAHPGDGHQPHHRTSRSSSRSDKEETNKILATLGLPVPQQELVQSDERRPCAPRERMGFPVVTKPYNGNHGRGISIRLTTDEEVAQGFAAAREHSRSVIVETFLRGR